MTAVVAPVDIQDQLGAALAWLDLYGRKRGRSELNIRIAVECAVEHVATAHRVLAAYELGKAVALVADVAVGETMGAFERGTADDDGYRAIVAAQTAILAAAELVTRT